MFIIVFVIMDLNSNGKTPFTYKTIEMKLLRKIENKTRGDRINNHIFKHHLKIESINAKLQKDN